MPPGATSIKQGGHTKAIIALVALLIVLAAAIVAALYLSPTAPSQDLSASTLPATTTARTSPAAAPKVGFGTTTAAEIVGFAATNAVPTDRITLTRCMADPLVASVKEGAQISFVNADTATRTIEFGPKQIYSIPGGSTFAHAADFARAPAVMVFSCSGIERAGALYITK